LLALGQCIYAQQTHFPKLTGPYLGQKPPGMTPEIFAAGIVSTKEDEYACEVNKAGDEILFMRKSQIMLAKKNTDSTWNLPIVAPFSGMSIDDEPCYSPDGSKIYFVSRRPARNSKSARNLWVVEKYDNKWGEPKLVKLPSSNRILHAPSVSSNNSIYDDGISITRFANGRYLEQKYLPGISGMYPFIAPDESYIIYSRRDSGRAGADLFISFKNKGGLLDKDLSLGSEINSSKNEGNSFVTADGKYLFFSRGYDIYWVSAKIIEDLRPKK
jgi:hypothetical protein